MELPKAANPSHDELAADTQAATHRGAVGAGVEDIGIESRAHDDDSFLGNAHASDLLGHELGAARDEIGTAEDPRLAELLEQTTPPGSPNAPLSCLPHQRRRHEQHGGSSERSGELDAGGVEELVALPDEAHIVVPPCSIRRDVKRPRPAPLAGVFHGRLCDDRQTPPPGSLRSGRELRVRRSASHVVDRHQAGGSHDPGVADDPSGRGRPPGRAHPRTHRPLLACSRGGQHEDRACGPIVHPPTLSPGSRVAR